MGSGPSMEDHLFNLRYSAKSLSKEAKKSEASSASNKIKCKKAMEAGNMEGARIFAESAIRDKNTALNYLRLSSRIDAVSQRVNTACKMNNLTKDMSGIVKSMEGVMKTMDVEKITAVMDKFEQQFENLDLATGVMENSMMSSTAQAMPESQVENLMQQVADEHGLEFAGGLNALPNGVNKLGQKVEQPADAQKAKSNVLIAGGANPAAAAAAADSSKKGPKSGDDKPAAGGGSGGAGGMAFGDIGGGARSPAGDDEESLEERLKRLQQ